MSASRTLTLPNKIIQIKNKKQQLYNDLIEHLESNNIMWYADEVADDGEKFLTDMVDLLWYIDGHHDDLTTEINLIVGQNFLDTIPLKHRSTVKGLFKTCLHLFLGNIQTTSSTVCKESFGYVAIGSHGKPMLNL